MRVTFAAPPESSSTRQQLAQRLNGHTWRKVDDIRHACARYGFSAAVTSVWSGCPVARVDDLGTITW